MFPDELKEFLAAGQRDLDADAEAKASAAAAEAANEDKRWNAIWSSVQDAIGDVIPPELLPYVHDDEGEIRAACGRGNLTLYTCCLMVPGCLPVRLVLGRSIRSADNSTTPWSVADSAGGAWFVGEDQSVFYPTPGRAVAAAKSQFEEAGKRREAMREIPF